MRVYSTYRRDFYASEYHVSASLLRYCVLSLEIEIKRLEILNRFMISFDLIFVTNDLALSLSKKRSAMGK